MIRVEISCNRCNAQLGTATGNVPVDVLNQAIEKSAGKFFYVAGHMLHCDRCKTYLDWLATPADKRGPAPADPCARADR